MLQHPPPGIGRGGGVVGCGPLVVEEAVPGAGVQLDVVRDAAGVEHLVQLAPGRDRRLGNAQQRMDRLNKAIGPLIAQKLR
jgi:hypothetical protein